MGSRWKHFKTICKHKAVVFQECRACGITWRGIVHDLSKFSRVEFASSAKHFQGTGSPIEKEKAEKGYSVAWLHHKGHNRHHWEWWTDFGENGEVIANEIPVVYVVEMLCDWIGAGKVYNKTRWTTSEPLEYYNKVRRGRHFHPNTEKLIIYLLEILKRKGIHVFHMECKDLIRFEKRLDRIFGGGAKK